MNLRASFPEAQGRHWEDAELLYARQRWGNADQLFGLSAECGLKAVMARHGMPLNASGHPLEHRHRKHIQALWAKFKRFSEHRAAAYVRALPPASPFSDWSHHNRYSGTGYTDRAAVDRHRGAARHIRQMVRLMEQDGMP